MLLIEYFKSKIFIRTIITILVSVVIGVFLLKFLLGYITHHDQKIKVPDLAKMSLNDTKRTLENLDLKFKIIDSTSFNPNFPPKSVISQDPEAGDFVKENRKIYLTLNPSGYRKVAIPNVLNKTKRQVETHLKSVGFRIGEYYYIPDLGRDVVRKMKFKGKEVKPGDMIPKNSEIDLVMGDGKAGGN
ncbi:MAG TPA: PASTA domain-containing protein [Flavobacteriia bacterium]|nr:PASTA domain-containing protein [Flavobacteriia bacterium]